MLTVKSVYLCFSKLTPILLLIQFYLHFQLEIEEDNLDHSGNSAQIEISETDSGSTSQHKDRRCPSQTKRKKKSKQLEACGMEALHFMKKFVENKPVKKPAGKEEELCKYLYGLLKRIQLEETFEELSFKIIKIVLGYPSPITPNLSSTPFSIPSPIHFNSHPESSLSTSSSKSIHLANHSPITSPNLTSTIPSPINFNSHVESSISTSSSNTTPSLHVPSPEPYLSKSHSPSSTFSRNSFKITSFIPAVPHSNPIPIQQSNKPIILQNILIKKSNSTRNVLERAMDSVLDIDDNNL